MIRSVFAVVALAGSAGGVFAQPITYRTVAVAGQVVPGSPGSSTVRGNYTSLRINDRGETAFTSLVSAGQGSLATAVLTDSGAAGLRTIARTGEQAPGQDPGFTFSAFNQSLLLNNAGDVAFTGFNPSFVATPFVQRVGGPLESVYRLGGPVPGQPADWAYGNLIVNSLRLNDSGDVILTSQVANAPSLVVHRSTPAGLAVAGVRGQSLPGLPAGTTISTIRSPRDNQINNAGQYAFVAELASGFSSQTALLRVNSSGIATPLGVRDTPLSASSSNTFSGALFDDSVRMNNQGAVSFVAGIRDEQANQQFALVVDDGNGQFSRVIAPGDQAPGLAPGVNVEQVLGFQTQMNNLGDLAFVARLSGDGVNNQNNFAIFAGGPGDLRAAVRQGDAVPGLAGVTFTSILGADHQFNDLGQVAFYAGLSDNTRGIFVNDALGGTRLVVGVNTVLDFNPDPLIEDLRPVVNIETSFDLNNQGQLVFNAFADASTSAVFVANIPAPTTGLALAIGGVLASRRRRR